MRIPLCALPASNLRIVKSAPGENILDLVSLSVAGMRDGVGPLLTVFLIQKTHLDPRQLAWILAAPSFINIFFQVPVGLLYDKIRCPERLLAAGAFLMACAAFGISKLPNFFAILGMQVITGFACCLISVGMPALCLVVVSSPRFGARLARNEIFSKIGNFGAIAVTGYVAQNYSLSSIFYVAYLLAAMLFVSAMLIPSRERLLLVNKPVEIKSIPCVFCTILSRPFFVKILFGASLYQFANASLFLIFEQSFVRLQKNGGAGILSISIFITQIIIILAGLAVARWTKSKNALLVLAWGFALILFRSILFACQFGLVSLMAAQLLDGCIAAILIIVPIRAIASANDENFNVMSGVLGMCVALGAALSTLMAGWLMSMFGVVNSFLVFGLIAACGLATMLFLKLSDAQTKGNDSQSSPDIT